MHKSLFCSSWGFKTLLINRKNICFYFIISFKNFLTWSLNFLHEQMRHCADVILNDRRLLPGHVWGGYGCLDVQELVGLDWDPHRELTLSEHGHPSVTDLTLLIVLPLVQHVHRLEVLLQAVHVLQHPLAVRHLLPSHDVLVLLEVPV